MSHVSSYVILVAESLFNRKDKDAMLLEVDQDWEVEARISKWRIDTL